MTVVIGFGAHGRRPLDARAALARGFHAAAARYAGGWHRYLGGLKPRPPPGAFGPTTTCR